MNCCCKTTDCRCADIDQQEATQAVKMEWLEEQNQLLKAMYLQLMEAYHQMEPVAGARQTE